MNPASRAFVVAVEGVDRALRGAIALVLDATSFVAMVLMFACVLLAELVRPPRQ